MILPRLSPTRVNSRSTPAPDNAEVLVARGKSPSTSRKSTKLGSVWRSGCLPIPFKNLSFPRKITVTCTQLKPHFCNLQNVNAWSYWIVWLTDYRTAGLLQKSSEIRPVSHFLHDLPLQSHMQPFWDCSYCSKLRTGKKNTTKNNKKYCIVHMQLNSIPFQCCPSVLNKFSWTGLFLWHLNLCHAYIWTSTGNTTCKHVTTTMLDNVFFKKMYTVSMYMKVNLYSASLCHVSKALRYVPCVTRRSHSFTCHPHTNQPAFTPQPQASPPFGWHSLCLPMKGWPGWVDLGGWLHTKINVRHWKLNSNMVTHSSTHQAQHRLTLLRPMRYATTTPDYHHAAHLQ